MPVGFHTIRKKEKRKKRRERGGKKEGEKRRRKEILEDRERAGESGESEKGRKGRECRVILRKVGIISAGVVNASPPGGPGVTG